MALQKSKTTDTGATGDYWKVTSVVVPNSSTERPQAVVSLFKDSAARSANKTPMERTLFSWNPESSPVLISSLDAANSNPIKKIYEKLVASEPFFSNATNV